jgi:predicted RNA-binding protein associated with RNAse of E/G family
MTTFGRSGAITVTKRDHLGEKVLDYQGDLLAHGDTWVCLIAPYNHPDKDAGYVVFRRGDTFVEWHYSDRWYNVFELYDVDDGHLKGWYCNITRPAIITQNTVRADDLALDVFVSPDHSILVLDEDEFAALPLSPKDQRAAWAAVEAIRRAVEAHEAPFEPPQNSVFVK